MPQLLVAAASPSPNIAVQGCPLPWLRVERTTLLQSLMEVWCTRGAALHQVRGFLITQHVARNSSLVLSRRVSGQLGHRPSSSKAEDECENLLSQCVSSPQVVKMFKGEHNTNLNPQASDTKTHSQRNQTLILTILIEGSHVTKVSCGDSHTVSLT